MDDAALVKELRSRIFLARGDGFDEDYYDYLDDNAHKPLKQSLRERRFSVGETDVAYRVINYWEEKRLLPKRGKDEGWRKFSFVELIWLKVIQRLRNYGIPISTIKATKKNVMRWDDDLNTYPVFEYYIVKALASTTDPYVVVLPDGRGDIGSSREVEAYKSNFSSTDAVLISLKSILSELGLSPVRPEPLLALSKEEVELIHAIRYGGHKEIRIEAPASKLRKIKTIEVHPEKPMLGDIERELKDSEAYAEVIIKYEKGRRQSAQVRKTKRFK